MYSRDREDVVGADLTIGMESDICLMWLVRIMHKDYYILWLLSDKILSTGSSEWHSTLCSNSGWEPTCIKH